jgi:hypothetical protein
MGRAQESAIYGGQGHLPFVRDGVPAPRPVELHWRFCAARLPWSPAVGDVLARATTVTFAGRQLFVPSREDQLLLALLHGTRHEWEQLEWVAGVAALISAGDVDVDTVLARAAGIGGLRAALTGLEIARLTLGVRLPSAVEERIRGDANVATVVRTLLPRVACTGQPPVSSAWSRRLALALLERPRDRVRFLACSAFLPTPREWELVKLPAPLAALYFPLRIARLAARIRPRAR